MLSVISFFHYLRIMRRDYIKTNFDINTLRYSRKSKYDLEHHQAYLPKQEIPIEKGSGYG
jgi:hypothetical protein